MAQPYAFNTGTQYAAGPTPLIVQSGDFNNDGIPDLVVASFDTNVWVMLGNGDGTFKKAVPYAVGGQPVQDVAVSDLNCDGKLDLVATTYKGPVYALLGKGDGTFQQSANLQILAAERVALADLDGDGKVDLILTAISPKSGIAVYLGKGDGSFSAQKTLISLPSQPYSRIVVTDFNGDGKPDLAVNTFAGLLCLMLSKGGGFQAPITLNAGHTPSDGDFAVADFNGDHKLDIAVPVSSLTQIGVIKIMLGNGDGTFRPAINLSNPPSSGATDVVFEPTAIAVADFDGDGHLDVVTRNVGSDLFMFLGKGDGTFGPLLRFTPSFQWFARSIVVADFNRDGKPDLAIAESIFDPKDPGGDVFVLLGGKIPPQSLPRITSFVNGAGFIHGGVVVPGEIVSIFGSNIGPPELMGAVITSDGFVAESNSGVTVLFDDLAAPLLAVGANQINAVVPFEVSARPATKLRIQYNEFTSDPITLSVVQGAPGVFTQDGSGHGQAAALNQDGSLNSADNPAEKGSIVSIYLTGAGQTDPPALDGQLANNAAKLVHDVMVGIGNQPAQVLYGGAAPGLVAGLVQVNVRVPADAVTDSSTPLVAHVGDRYSQPGVTIAVK